VSDVEGQLYRQNRNAGFGGRTGRNDSNSGWHCLAYFVTAAKEINDELGLTS
jgi:hypothetical protein